MSAATATIITGAALAASAGASVYGAKKGASAARNAAATQSAAADKGLALQRQMYEQQQAHLLPYRQLGAGSLQNLGNFQSFAGVPGAFGAGVNPQYQRALSPGMPAAPQMGGPGPAAPPQGVPRSQPTGRVGPVPRGAQGTLANPGGQPPIDMVPMRAPTGEEMAVPADQVQHYLGKGAQIIQDGVA